MLVKPIVQLFSLNLTKLFVNKYYDFTNRSYTATEYRVSQKDQLRNLINSLAL